MPKENDQIDFGKILEPKVDSIIRNPDLGYKAIMENINNKWMEIPQGSLDFSWDPSTFYTLGNDFAELL